MASITTEPNGRRTIQVAGPDGKRRSIRLGKVSMKYTNSVKVKVESLAAARIARVALDDETARWLAEIGDSLYEKLFAVKLVDPRAPTAEPATPALGTFIDEYIVGRTDLKPNSVRNNRGDAAIMVRYFGRDRPLGDITPGDADGFVVWLKGEGFARATIGRLLKRCRHFFRVALRRRIIADNPFADVKTPAQTNESRKFFVTRDATARLLDACPDADWRLLVALSRFGGLRCPSETLALRWGDVDWERGRVRVRSPKTEHLPGGDSREIPLFPELRTHLEDAFDRAEPGTVYVVNRYRDADKNLRTGLLRIIRRAGLEAWPKPFHNLRASRETELAESFPMHVVCKWIGNSAQVAGDHYLTVTDDHFASAAKGGAESGAVAVQNAVQTGANGKGQEGHETAKPLVAQGFRRELSAPVLCGQVGHVPPRGIEPLS